MADDAGLLKPESSPNDTDEQQNDRCGTHDEQDDEQDAERLRFSYLGKVAHAPASSAFPRTRVLFSLIEDASRPRV